VCNFEKNWCSRLGLASKCFLTIKISYDPFAQRLVFVKRTVLPSMLLLIFIGLAIGLNGLYAKRLDLPLCLETSQPTFIFQVLSIFCDKNFQFKCENSSGLELRDSCCLSLIQCHWLSWCSSKMSAKSTLGPPSYVECLLLLCLAIGYCKRRGIWWLCPFLIHWKWRQLMTPAGIAFDWFNIHCSLSGRMGPWPQFFWLVKQCTRLPGGMDNLFLFFPGWSESVFSFSHGPDPFLLFESVLTSPFPDISRQGPKY